MKVFLPFKRDLNPYLDEIEQYSRFEFVYSWYTHYEHTFKIVNIHWPEAIFDWLEPTDKQLDSLEKEIKKWKKNSKVVYTLHDEQRHKGMTPNFFRLFNLIEESADMFIHLGEFSKGKYEKRYPRAKHRILFHPFYKKGYTRIEKEVARQKLGIGNQSIVFIVPGHIRNKEEKSLVLKAFKNLAIENKVLIATRMRNEMEFNFRGRVRLKQFLDVQHIVLNRFKKKHQPPIYYFSYNRASAENLSLAMSASDIVIIPRINSLNSGILFLGMAYEKIVVGPGIGNIVEHLIKLKYPVFDPTSHQSLKNSLNKAVTLNEEGFTVKQSLLDEFNPKNIGNQFDDILKKLNK